MGQRVRRKAELKLIRDTEAKMLAPEPLKPLIDIDPTGPPRTLYFAQQALDELTKGDL